MIEADEVVEAVSIEEHRRGFYECDGGSLKIGAGGFSAAFPNFMGDGEHVCHVLEGYRSIRPDICLEGDWVFEGTVKGDEITVYEYDCGDEPLFQLKGRYGVYAKKNSGDMCLVKWE